MAFAAGNEPSLFKNALVSTAIFLNRQRHFQEPFMNTLREQIRDQKYPNGFMKPAFSEIVTQHKLREQGWKDRDGEWGKLLHFPVRR